MLAQTRSPQFRRDSSASSELSQPSPSLEARIQGDLLEQACFRQQRTMTADSEMVDHYNGT